LDTPDPHASLTSRVVLIHPDAPVKPRLGAECNGCGVCCLWAPCPLGAAVSRRTRGPCKALTWSDEERRYLCGVVVDPGRHVPWLPARWTQGLARRWISAGRGCDADLEPSEGSG
jgi:hypothetical protein